ncbi:hypothetical protein ACFYOK_33750 [Microbispora bryophytorum]|uniref:hypothetical protein n=1 Tax=Microbispora bryophytorum TaxID=1460882 RepID=UPI0033F12B95
MENDYGCGNPVSCDVPAALQAGPEPWSGCCSGALQEERFLEGFTRAGLTGLTGLTILKREERPWETVRDVGFRRVTVAAREPASQVSPTAPAARRRGPFAAVALGTGLRLVRGRVAPLRP